jgi:hypothetical protein
MPFSEIKIGDIFSNPLLRGFGELQWHVIKKNKEEKLIQISAFDVKNCKVFGKPI